jgi:hypothetical protein
MDGVAEALSVQDSADVGVYFAEQPDGDCCIVPGELYRTAYDHAIEVAAGKADLKQCERIG